MTHSYAAPVDDASRRSPCPQDPLSDALIRTLDRLQTDGFVLLPTVLDASEVELIRVALNAARDQGWQDGLNDVGNMWFDTLLEREPQTYRRLVAHPGVSPYLQALFGRQCQLRCLRAHINPGPYTQEWHLDFYGYWEEKRRLRAHPLASLGVGVNSTFYFQDNVPGRGSLTFLRGTHVNEPPHLYPLDYQAFAAWCEEQEPIVLHPNAGDCVLFYSHMVHRGAKHDQTMERSNVVCHYQGCPMHETVWHVGPQRTLTGSFPFAYAQ